MCCVFRQQRNDTTSSPEPPQQSSPCRLIMPDIIQHPNSQLFRVWCTLIFPLSSTNLEQLAFFRHGVDHGDIPKTFAFGKTETPREFEVKWSMKCFLKTYIGGLNVNVFVGKQRLPFCRLVYNNDQLTNRELSN